MGGLLLGALAAWLAFRKRFPDEGSSGSGSPTDYRVVPFTDAEGVGRGGELWVHWRLIIYSQRILFVIVGCHILHATA